MHKIALNKLIADKSNIDLRNIDIILEKVHVVKEEMELHLFMVSKNKCVKDNLINEISDHMQNIFRNFKVIVNISYLNVCMESEFLDDYIKEIIEIIRIKVPSSMTWIDDIKYKVENKDILLYLPNRAAKLSLDRRNLIQFINKKIHKELSLIAKIIVLENEDVDKEEFLKLKKEEEKRLALNISKQLNEGINYNKSPKSLKKYIIGKEIKSKSVNIKDVNIQSGTVTVTGNVFQIDNKEIKGNRNIVTIFVSDGSDSIPAKIFLSTEQTDQFLANISENTYLTINGDITYDSFSKCQTLMIKSLNKVEKLERMDTADEKRIELHLHTQMSSMDGITNLESVIKRAHKWGHKAIAVTDHGVVQAFPEAMNMSNKLDLKIIYGVEGYLVNDQKMIVSNYDSNVTYKEYTVFDIETTGLSAINDEITEIGAIKIKDGKVIDTFSQLINPGRKIPQFITELTGISDEMVSDKPKIEQVIPSFKDFIANSVLVAHNSDFDTGFIREKFRRLGIILDNPVLDTLELSRAVFPELKNHKLNTLAKHLNVNLENHHRAVDDAAATKEIFLSIINLLSEKEINSFDEINSLNANKDISKEAVFHVVILAKNLIGLKNLYKIISDSHLEYFHRRPRIPKSLLNSYREGLLVGTACESGELYKAILGGKSYSEIREIIKFYDYLEIQPLANNYHLIRNGLVKDERQLEKINTQIVELGEKYNKYVVATGDVHFLDPEDEVYRRILMTGQGFNDAEEQAPLYFKTTDEMLAEFNYLGEDKAYEVVVENTNKINDLIDKIKPIPDGTFPPIINGAEEELRKITYERAHELYGNPLPTIVENRLNRELTSIIENGYAVMYIIAQKLVWKSIEDGYLVGSRGSVGSSFVATMSGITEVNPLPPHYICPKCKFNQFFIKGEIASGSDLKDKFCPDCNTKLNKDGQDIPFEVFLGFEGDKEPDIDLNFAGEYQAKAHRYTEELFGEGYVYRAGTIGTIADKTAFGFVKKYFEQKEVDVNPAEINRLVKGCTGIKRTSGQHPGGVMIVPTNKDILDFTPIQYPANDKKSGVITTHFDYNAISGRILKLDILGHDVPTIIKMLEEITGVNSTSIPLDEPMTMKLFQNLEPLNISAKDLDCPVGTLGIPEFGTKFVRQMLVETKPTTFSELVRISGLSHGTDVWINNAQDLIKHSQATLSEVISTREDIMLYLINAGLDKQRAFWIMENVRKGKGLTKEDEDAMRALDLPNWYIDSCNRIKYMFPKAHAVAYVMMSFRIAYFKVYYPESFYATYFTTKAIDFDAQLILKGLKTMNQKIDELERLGNEASGKEKNLMTVLEVAREMYLRGYKFRNVDLYESHSDKFIISDKGILPPLKSLDGVGENAARKIVQERSISRFISIEDLVKRSKVTKTVIEALENHGCLEGIPQSDQMSLFNV